MGSREQKYLEEAYKLVVEQEEEALTKLKTFEPGKIYKDSTREDSEYNNYKFTTGYGKSTGFQRLYAQGTSVVTDNAGVLRMPPRNILNMVPSDMPVEGFDKKHNAHWNEVTKEIQKYKYFD
jgi:hypothetical protein